MQQIILNGTTPDQLVKMLVDSLDSRLQSFEQDLNHKKENDDLLTREQACDFLSINPSTLWAWTNKGKVKAYGIANRRYYKRSELLESLIPLKK